MLDLFRDPVREAFTTYLYVFGCFTIIGGVIGYVKAKSLASLIAGSISGALLLVAGWLIAQSGNASRPGVFLALGVSAALALRFGKAYRTTKKVFPALVITLLSVGAIALGVLVLSRWRS